MDGLGFEAHFHTPFSVELSPFLGVWGPCGPAAFTLAVPSQHFGSKMMTLSPLCVMMTCFSRSICT